MTTTYQEIEATPSATGGGSGGKGKTMAKKRNQIVGGRSDRDEFETLAYTSAAELDEATIAEYREEGYDYLEIQNRDNEEDEYDVIDSWSDDGRENPDPE